MTDETEDYTNISKIVYKGSDQTKKALFDLQNLQAYAKTAASIAADAKVTADSVMGTAQDAVTFATDTRTYVDETLANFSEQITNITGGNFVTLDDDQTITGTKTFENQIIATGGVVGDISGNAGSATQLETARTFITDLASTSTASFDGSENVSPGVTGILAIENGGTGNSTGLAASATRLATARTISLAGEVTGSTSFNGTSNVSINCTVDDDVLDSIVPTGSIFAYMGQDDTIPAGYLLCNGASVNRSTYANLYNVIGTKFGTGNGTTTFTLPNLDDMWLRGTSSTPGDSLSAALPDISGYFRGQALYNQGSYLFYGAIHTGTTWSTSGASTTNSQTLHYLNFDASYSNSIYGNDTTVVPASYTVRFIIKY